MGTGRFISGIGSGAATVICPIYIAEISPAEKRGHFGAFTQVMINGGILIAQLSGYFLNEDNYWRIILVQAAAIAAFEFCGLIIAPETPKWLAENNRPAMGRRVLQKIRGREANIQAEMENWEWSGEPEEESLLGPQRGERPEKQPAASMLDILRIPRYRKAVIAVTAAMMAQQLTGINSVVMYSVTILGAIIPSAAALVTVLVSAINVLVTVLCAPLADKIGRKACLLISIAGMGSNSVLLAIGLSFDYPILSVLATLLFVCSFGVGLGPIPFILASELVDSEAVGAISSWALAGNWLSTFCVAQFFPMLNNALPRGQVYWGFAAVALVFGVFIAWWLPESMGRANVEEVWAAHEGRFQDVQDLEPEVEDIQDEA
jgi:sugar porter (SP) family MFS transporter